MPKYIKQVFLFCRVITKIRRIDGKFTLINEKHDYNN
jgi:hypothetical protein